MRSMKIIITCGPAYEPIDRMRRITNASTGELGLMLAGTFSEAGHNVVVFKSEMASSFRYTGNSDDRRFSTNEDLLSKLRSETADVVFHAAALCDFRVAEVRGADGALVDAAKIPTHAGEITLKLSPAKKVLPELRGIFPNARIVGWKYELDGTREDVLAKAVQQMNECSTDACVVNGDAWGEGFGFVVRDAPFTEIETRRELYKFLLGQFGA
jgi:phosphopantothenate---cysteine ligase (CTP)